MLIPLGDDAHLVLLQERHVDDVFALVDAERERLREWLPWVDANVTRDDTLRFVREQLERFAREGGPQLAIMHRGAVAGVIGFHDVDRANAKCEVGYWLGSRHEGHGLVTRALAAVLDLAFREMRLHRIEVRCAPGNARSRAIPERLGFVEEGRLRDCSIVGDRFEDLVVYGMLAPEWFARPGSAP